MSEHTKKILTWTIIVFVGVWIFEGIEDFSDAIGTLIGSWILVYLVMHWSNPASENSEQTSNKKEEPAAFTQKTKEKEDIKKIYMQLQKKYHPDFARSEEDKKLRTDIIVKINNAYSEGNIEVLKLFM